MNTVLLSIVFASIVSTTLYSIGFWGGGDCKLFIAISPIFEPFQLINFLLYTLVFGGLLAVGYLIKNAIMQNKESLKGMPYGVSIISSALICYFLSIKS